MKYDYLIVGAGLFGAVFAHEMTRDGKSCLIIDKRDHIAGNVYTKKRADINVHWYGAHIFHTSNRATWDYINQFAEFNNFINSPMAVYKDELYNLPFNMNTFSKMWNIRTPKEAKDIIEAQIKDLNITGDVRVSGAADTESVFRQRASAILKKSDIFSASFIYTIYFFSLLIILLLSKLLLINLDINFAYP